MYYNTTQLAGNDLNGATNRAASQTLIILKFFLAHPYGLFTPIEVHKALGEKFLLTSVRRSISCLTLDEYLIKTETTCRETYGAINFKWKLNPAFIPTRQLNIFE
jgi:hypothetical protein